MSAAMFGDSPLTFREWATREPHPVAVVQDAVLVFLRGRKDAVLYGGHAVNAYVTESRYTADVNLASPRSAELAQELQALLRERFRIAVRLLEGRDDTGYRIFQTRKPRNRHLIDVRPVPVMPPCRPVKGVLVATPPEVIAGKLMRMVGRRKTLKAFQDKADLYRLLLTFPKLKREEGPVAKRLRAAEAGEDVIAAWKELVAQDIRAEEDDDEFQ